MGLLPAPKHPENVSYLKKVPFVLAFFLGVGFLYQIGLGGWKDKRMIRRETYEAKKLASQRAAHYEMRRKAIEDRMKRLAEEREKDAAASKKPDSTPTKT